MLLQPWPIRMWVNGNLTVVITSLINPDLHGRVKAITSSSDLNLLHNCHCMVFKVKSTVSVKKVLGKRFSSGGLQLDQRGRQKIMTKTIRDRCHIELCRFTLTI